jgi:hypothetical protein
MRPVEHVEEEALEYEAPQIVDYGDLIELTAGSSDGCYLDADYPVLTKKSALGFSGSC